MTSELPSWAEEMRDLFKSGSVAQFLIHGNLFDIVPAPGPSGRKLVPLKTFLDEVMFDGYDIVQPQWFRNDGIHYTVEGSAQRAARTAQALVDNFPATPPQQ